MTVVTSSPFKQALELAKKKKEAEKHPVVKKKSSNLTKKGSKRTAGRRKVKESDSEDKPLSSVCKKRRRLNITSADSTKCHSCNVQYSTVILEIQEQLTTGYSAASAAFGCMKRAL